MFPCAFQSRLLSSFSVCDSPAEAGRTASVSAAGVRLSVQTCACDSRSRGGTFGRGDLGSLGTTRLLPWAFALHRSTIHGASGRLRTLEV